MASAGSGAEFAELDVASVVRLADAKDHWGIVDRTCVSCL
jgi:hypothetical protein